MPALARNSPRAQQREKLQTKSRGRRVQARAPGAMSAAVASHRHRQGQLVICSHRRRDKREGPDFVSQVAGRGKPSAN